MTAPQVKFTFAGILALVILALVLASSDTFGSIVLYLLAALILLVLVVNYRNTLSVFFTSAKGG